MENKARIQVAVGIVFNQQGEVLVGQRTVQDRYFEKWEFPGGKLEQGESVKQALVREFREEVGIEIIDTQPFMKIEHDYPDRAVELHVQTVHEFDGEPASLEGQAIRWVAINDLPMLDFLQGNQAMIEKLQREFGNS